MAFETQMLRALKVLFTGRWLLFMLALWGILFYNNLASAGRPNIW